MIFVRQNLRLRTVGHVLVGLIVLTQAFVAIVLLGIIGRIKQAQEFWVVAREIPLPTTLRTVLFPEHVVVREL